MSISQKGHEMASSEELAVLPTNSAKHELQVFMVLAPLLCGSMTRKNSDVIQCSVASPSGGATMYSCFDDWHPSPNELRDSFLGQLSKKKIQNVNRRVLHSTNLITRSISMCSRVLICLLEFVDWHDEIRRFQYVIRLWSIRKCYITKLQKQGPSC